MTGVGGSGMAQVQPVGASAPSGGAGPWILSARDELDRKFTINNSSVWFTAAQWVVDWDLICGTDPNVRVELMGALQASDVTSSDMPLSADVFVDGPTPGVSATSGTQIGFTVITGPTDASAASLVGGAAVIAKPSTPLVQIGMLAAMDPLDSVTVPGTGWAFVVYLSGTSDPVTT